MVELGCGTGLNFELLHEKIGPTGRLIGVDLTDAMLEVTHRRVVDKGWRNVELVQNDALDYDYPAAVNGIISTFALSLIPECDLVIQRAAQALALGGRITLLELQMPNYWPDWLISIAMAFIRPFTLSDEWLERRPWHTIGRAMLDKLTDVNVENRFFSTTYIISGLQRATGPKRPN